MTRTIVQKLHDAADKANDVQARDELHAAAAIMQYEPGLAFQQLHVRRWVQGVCDRHKLNYTVRPRKL